MASEDVERLFEQAREEKDIFQKAKLLHTLQKQEDIPLKHIAEALQMKPPYVSHILRLNRLPDMIVDGYYSGLVSASHLFIISRLRDQNTIIETYEKVLADSLNSTQTEQLVREYLHGVKTEGEYLSKDEKDQYRYTGKKGNARISIDIIQSRIKTKSVIEIKATVKEANELLRHLMKKIEEWRSEEGL